MFLLVSCASAPKKAPGKRVQVPGKPQLVAEQRSPLERLSASETWDATTLWELGKDFLNQSPQKFDVFYALVNQTAAWKKHPQLQSLQLEHLVKQDKIDEARALALEIKAETLPLAQQPDFLRLRASLLKDSHKAEYINTLVALDTLNNTPEHNSQIWQQLMSLTSTDKAALNKQDRQIQAWLDLLSLTQRAPQQELQQALQNWQSANPDRLAAQQLPFTLNLDSLGKISKVAIVLPLSGTYSAQGLAVRDGIIYAQESDTQRELFFFDSAQLDMESFKAQLALLEIDFIIGPLLKDKVEAFIQADINQPMLLLNAPETGLEEQRFVLSLTPENEAEQAGRWLANMEQAPIILSANGKVYQRMAQAFIDQWPQAEQPKVNLFNDTAELGKKIRALMGTAESRKRINQLKWGHKYTVLSDERSRKDVSRLYFLGSPTDTRLLKPFVDVNTSPFAKQIKVYASSRSHSLGKEASDAKDLDQLRFTELPWLLPGDYSKNLAYLKTLFPNRNSANWRLTALGYDAHELLSQLNLMSQLPSRQYQGATGKLHLNADGKFSRIMPWAQFRQGGLSVVEE